MGTNEMGDEEWKCPDHGPMCNPGICKERALIERHRLRQNEQELLERWHSRRPKDQKSSYLDAGCGNAALGPNVEYDTIVYPDAHKLFDGSTSANDDSSLKEWFDSLLESHEPEESQLQPTWDMSSRVSTRITVSSIHNEQLPSLAQRHPP